MSDVSTARRDVVSIVSRFYLLEELRLELEQDCVRSDLASRSIVVGAGVPLRTLRADSGRNVSQESDTPRIDRSHRLDQCRSHGTESGVRVMEEMQQIRRLVFDRAYGEAEARIIALARERPTMGLRRLLATVLRSQGAKHQLDAAVRILDSGVRAMRHLPDVQVLFWLDLGRTLAARDPLDPLAVRALEETVPMKATAPLVVARADQEHARLEGDKWRERMLASAVIGTRTAVGEAHAFVDGVFILGHVLGLPEHTHEIAGVRARIYEIRRSDRLAVDVEAGLARALDAVGNRALDTAELELRQALGLAKSTGVRRSHVRSVLSALAAVLSALGRFEEAEVAADDAALPEERLLRSLKRS